MDVLVFPMINKEIELDTSKFPKMMRDIIHELEEYDANGDWVAYDNISDGLEVLAKHCYANHIISQYDYNQILKKYRWEV